MSPEEWEVYVDTGFIKMEYLNDLAIRILNAGKLDLKDLQVYQTHAGDIEKILSINKPKSD